MRSEKKSQAKAAKKSQKKATKKGQKESLPFPTASIVRVIAVGVPLCIGLGYASELALKMSTGVFGFLIFGVIAAWIADGKKRPTREAWLLTLFCGPLALAIVAMLPELNEENRATQENQTGLMLVILALFLLGIAALIWQAMLPQAERWF